MPKKRITKSRLKTRLTVYEQRIRLVDRVRKINYRRPVEYVKRVPGFIRRRPFISFFLVLLLLAALIVLGSTVFKAKPLEEHKGEVIKQVETFKIGTSPKIAVQAEVEKTGVIKIVAQAPGIVSSINTYEGEMVEKGKNLISLSSNYYGGNAASVQRQIAQRQFKLSKETLDTQKELITRQRNVAERTDANADEMRDIANRSLEETRSLLDQNEALLSQTNRGISDLEEATAPADLSNSVIFQANAQRVQLQAAVNQLRQAVRNTELQAASDRPPAELSDLQREIALKNLDIQEKSLQANHEIAKLQVALAQVNEAIMFPTTPFKGVVEKVHVRVGESVSPGATLVTISGVEGEIMLDAKVPAATAKNLSKLENSELFLRNRTITLMPAYVSSEATQGQLHSIIYHVPSEYQEFFTDGGFVTVSIPVGGPDTNSVVPFIPLDAIFQTQEESTVYLNREGKAESRKIQLGDVQGGYVSVLEGIGTDDEIILSRNVVEGDKVRTE